MWAGCCWAGGRFIPVLWRFPGHFLSGEKYIHVWAAERGGNVCAGDVCPESSVFSGIFPFCSDGLSRFWCRNEDVLLVQGVFVPDVRCFPGYFPSAAMVCPGFGVEMRMFCWCSGCLSRKQCVFRDKVQ